jgi:hypothetical protein
MPPARREDSPAPGSGRALVSGARQQLRRHAERSGAGESSPEPQDDRARIDAGTTLLLAPGHEAGLAHGYPAARERLVPPPFGRAEVSAGSGRSACLRSRCRSPDTRARPPMLPVDTSGGRRYVTCHLRASALPVPVRFGTGHRLVGTGAEGSRRAEMPSGVYCARENQARAVPHIPRTFTPEGISAPSEPDVHPKFRPA